MTTTVEAGTRRAGATADGAGPQLRAGARFSLATFTELIRAAHPQRRFATAVSRLTVGELDREPDVATAWVYGAYATVLGRLPDPDGLRTYETQLRSGTTPSDFLTGLGSSAEARETAPDTAVALDDAFVVGAYLVALGRRPDPAGGEAARAALGGGADHRDVLGGLLRSPEAQRQMRFPPGPPAPEEYLARAIQEVVCGRIDPQLHGVLRQAVRDGRSVQWLVRTALRLSSGRRGLVRNLPRSWWLGRLAQRRAETESVLAAIEAGTTWNWRVQRQLLDEVGQLSRTVSALRAKARAKD